MKASVCNFPKIILLLLLIGFSAQTISAKEFKRDTTLQFDIAKNGVVGLSNKHGKIDVHTWLSNQVKIEIIITVNARNLKDANEVFDVIDVEFSQQNNYVSANTVISSNRSKLEYTIDYEVYMPTSCSLQLKNRYGNAVIANLKGGADVNVKYGNIRLSRVEEDLDIDLKYGNCKVVKASNARVKLEHGNIYLKEAGDVDFYSRSSKVFLDKANEITCDTRNDIYKLGAVKVFRNFGRYDNLDIQEVEHLIVESEYSDLFVGKLEVAANVKMKYGGVVFDNISPRFQDIILDGSETDFKIRVGEGAAYRVEVTGRYCAIRVPEIAKVIYDKTNNPKKEFKGYIGSNEYAPRFIKATVQNGSFKLR